MDNKKMVCHNGVFITISIKDGKIIPSKFGREIKDCVDRVYYEHYQMMCRIVEECHDKILHMFKTGVRVVNLYNFTNFEIESYIIRYVREFRQLFSIIESRWDGDNVWLTVEDTFELEDFFGNENYVIHHFNDNDDWFIISKERFEVLIRNAKYNNYI